MLVIAAQTHQLLVESYRIGRKRNDDRLATQEIGIHSLTIGAHHCHAATASCQIGYRQ